MEYVNFSIVGLIAGLVMGYYARGLNSATVKSDIAWIKNEITQIKNYFTPAVTPTSAPSTPVAPVS